MTKQQELLKLIDKLITHTKETNDFYSHEVSQLETIKDFIIKNF